MMERLNPDLQLFVIVIITVESFLRIFGDQINISTNQLLKTVKIQITEWFLV